MATSKSKIDLNQATTADLEKIIGIGPALARRIVAEKPFRHLTDLKKVSGIGDKFYAQIRHELRVPRNKTEVKPEIRRAQTKASVKQSSSPILTPGSKTKPDSKPTTSHVEDKEEPASSSKSKEATSQVSIPSPPKEELFKSKPDSKPALSHVEDKEEPAPISKPTEATPQVSIPVALNVEKLDKTEPESDSTADRVEEKEESTSPSKSRGATPPVLIPSPPKEELSKSKPDSKPALSHVEDKEESTTPSKPIEATPQVSIPVAPKVEKVDKTEPESDSTADRVEEKEEPASASKPREATPLVSIPATPKVEILERTSPPNVSIAIKPRRFSPWIYVIVGMLLVTVILAGAVASTRGLRQQTEVTSEATTVKVAQVDTATLVATQTTISEPQPSDEVAESTSPPSTSIPATNTTLPPTFSPDIAPTATATVTVTVQPTLEPTRAIDAILKEKFVFGSVLWTENFDPPTFNWGRGETDIAAASYVDGALQAILQTRVQPYWSLGPTYQVSSLNFYYEGVVSIESCRERDFYGLIFRADGADFYMFAITCDGDFRLLRRLDGSEDILNIAASPDVPLGPGQHRIGVSIHGKQIGLYVAGVLIHEYREQRLDQIPPGSFGVYARAVGTDLLKVRWDNLIATEILP